MSTWRESVLEQFPFGASRVMVALDPDGILADEGILRVLSSHGIEVLGYDDPIAFRLSYESKFRARWDNGETTLGLLVNARDASESVLPSDVAEGAPVVRLSVADLFPELAGSVIAGIDRRFWDGIHDAALNHSPESLSERETKEFILYRVFGVDVPGIVNVASLLAGLLQLHYSGIELPQVLAQHLVNVLCKSGRFGDWPIPMLVTDRRAFFRFLQERWPSFVEQALPSGAVVSREHAGVMEFTGPATIPFDDPKVRTFIDDVFAAGMLEPVRATLSGVTPDPWLAAGLLTDENAESAQRLEHLMQAAGRGVPGPDAVHGEWLAYALRWGEVLAVAAGAERPGDVWTSSAFLELQGRIDAAFANWLSVNYRSLHSLPPIPPVMVHHVLPDLARRRTSGELEKMLLLVIDGLALDQWVCLREGLLRQRRTITTRDAAVFAWVPTLTNVSRQALLAGHPPFYFNQSIQDTQQDGRRWEQFWHENGSSPASIRHINCEGTDRDLPGLQETLSDPAVDTVATVLTVVDNIMHGMQLGTAGMHNQVRQWCETGFLAGLLDSALSNGFSVFLTSDHGNIEAVGAGAPREGVIAEQRGLRARTYADSVARTATARQFPGTIEWDTAGLPDGFFPLLASHRRAFTTEGDSIVCHGAACIEEVAVPLVQIVRRLD